MSGLNIIEYNNINFYHITAIDNLLSILQSEGLYSDWENQQGEFNIQQLVLTI